MEGQSYPLIKTKNSVELEIFIQNIRMFVKYYKCLCINKWSFFFKQFYIK